MRQLLNVLLLHVLFAANFLFASASTPTPAAPADYPSRLQAMLAGETLQGNSPTPVPTSTPASPTVADAMAVDTDNACYQPQYVCTFPGEPYKTLMSWLYGWCMSYHDRVEGVPLPDDCFLRLTGRDYPWDGLLTVDGYEAVYGISLPGKRDSGGSSSSDGYCPAGQTPVCTHNVYDCSGSTHLREIQDGFICPDDKPGTWQGQHPPGVSQAMWWTPHASLLTQMNMQGVFGL